MLLHAAACCCMLLHAAACGCMRLHAATCCYILLLKFSFKETLTVTWFGSFSAVWAATMPSKGSFCAKSDALLIHYVKTTLGGTFHEKQEVQNFRATRAIPGMTRTPALPPSKLLRMRNETTFSHFPHPRTGCRQLKLCTLAQFCTLDTYQKTKIPELLIWTRTSPSKCSLFENAWKNRDFRASQNCNFCVNFSIFSSQAPRSRRALEDLAQNFEENIIFRRKNFGRKSNFSWFFIFFPLLHPIFFANFRRIL